MSRLLVTVILALLGGCASTPPMTYKYYPAKATTSVTVIQTITCTADKSALIVVNTPTITTEYAADRRAPPIEFDASPLRTAFSDSDLTISWFDDGRLKSINQSSTGEGEAIVKSAFTLIGALGLAGGAAHGKAAAALAPCTALPDLGAGKSVAVTFDGTVDFSDEHAGKPVNLTVRKGYEALHQYFIDDKGTSLLPLVQFIATKPTDTVPLAVPQQADDKDVAWLGLRRTAESTVSVSVSGQAIATSKVVLPSATAYALPIPKPKLFGKQSFTIALNEAGVVTSVAYSSTAGAAGALNALNTAQSTLSPGDAAKAAALKARADVIAQTERVAKCEASPTTCN